MKKAEGWEKRRGQKGEGFKESRIQGVEWKKIEGWKIGGLEGWKVRGLATHLHFQTSNLLKKGGQGVKCGCLSQSPQRTQRKMR
ncbi:MAG TPA: hypothetical protein PK661_04280 [Syntrophorhabdaceae bacterium]|nr:hypothetical protein [Syntrophorhabdaceae bacterium]HOS59293.1 hypothetical protein [Syntrophorhabdaceae bacterium]